MDNIALTQLLLVLIGLNILILLYLVRLVIKQDKLVKAARQNLIKSRLGEFKKKAQETQYRRRGFQTPRDSIIKMLNNLYNNS